MIARETFDDLYHQLATAWETHEALRRQHASLSDLAASSGYLEQARRSMRDWHRHNDARSI